MTTTTPMTTGRHAAVASPVRSQASPITLEALQKMATRQPLRKRRPALTIGGGFLLVANGIALIVLAVGATGLPQSWAYLAAATFGAGTGLTIGLLSARRANLRRSRLAGDILRQLQTGGTQPRTPE